MSMVFKPTPAEAAEASSSRSVQQFLATCVIFVVAVLVGDRILFWVQNDTLVYWVFIGTWLGLMAWLAVPDADEYRVTDEHVEQVRRGRVLRSLPLARMTCVQFLPDMPGINAARGTLTLEAGRARMRVRQHWALVPLAHALHAAAIEPMAEKVRAALQRGEERWFGEPRVYLLTRAVLVVAVSGFLLAGGAWALVAGRGLMARLEGLLSLVGVGLLVAALGMPALQALWKAWRGGVVATRDGVASMHRPDDRLPWEGLEAHADGFSLQLKNGGRTLLVSGGALNMAVLAALAQGRSKRNLRRSERFDDAVVAALCGTASTRVIE